MADAGSKLGTRTGAAENSLGSVGTPVRFSGAAP